ncbi:unnamed protein product [Amoebophrya sp. A25]|nr:unnamed protein product [Amoebophrya sp. A25]|eukprot:GSA25T00017786001.1
MVLHVTRVGKFFLLSVQYSSASLNQPTWTRARESRQPGSKTASEQSRKSRPPTRARTSSMICSAVCRGSGRITGLGHTCAAYAVRLFTWRMCTPMRPSVVSSASTCWALFSSRRSMTLCGRTWSRLELVPCGLPPTV